MLARIFLRHPASVGESYYTHARFAFWLAGRLAAAACASVVHAIIPAMFERTASRIISELYKKRNMDVLALDVMLPKTDGREICQSLRKLNNTTPILMLTALETTEDIARGLKMGADDDMTKPFSFDELVARLEVLANRGEVADRTTQNSVLSGGGVTFDRRALTVHYKDEVIELTSLEYTLLEFLMIEAGKVVSRTRILQNVWGTYKDPLTNVVDVYIGRLRSKLDVEGNDLITTVRGRGYRFNP